MAITRVQLNWTGVQYASTNITRVTSISPGMGGSLIKFSGDVDIFPTVIANAMNDPHVSITSADIATLHGFTPGQEGTLIATLNDAKAQAGGAIAWTFAQAVFENCDSSAQHAQFGSATATWQLRSTDGVTTPMTFIRS